MNNTFGAWKEVKFGVPQGSVLRPLLFNAFINDIFLFVSCTNICYYADDASISTCYPALETIVR